jgi:hypothetical protein
MTTASPQKSIKALCDHAPGERIECENGIIRYFLGQSGRSVRTLCVVRSAIVSYRWEIWDNDDDDDDRVRTRGHNFQNIHRGNALPAVISFMLTMEPIDIKDHIDLAALAVLHDHPHVRGRHWVWEGKSGNPLLSLSEPTSIAPDLLIWHLDGDVHRDGAPAMIYGVNVHKLADRRPTVCGPAPSVDETPVAIGEITYFTHGVQHRTDGPASLSVCTDCARIGCTVEEWILWGRRYRADGPCYSSCVEQQWSPSHRHHRPLGSRRDGTIRWTDDVPPEYPESLKYWCFATHGESPCGVRQSARAIIAATHIRGLVNLRTWWW